MQGAGTHPCYPSIGIQGIRAGRTQNQMKSHISNTSKPLNDIGVASDERRGWVGAPRWPGELYMSAGAIAVSPFPGPNLCSHRRTCEQLRGTSRMVGNHTRKPRALQWRRPAHLPPPGVIGSRRIERSLVVGPVMNFWPVLRIHGQR